MIENIRLSLEAILNHRLRSILTMLGIIVGIASIIAIFSMINGNTANMKKQMIGGQTNSMRIEYGPRNSFRTERGSGENKLPDYAPQIEESDLAKLLTIDHVKTASLIYQGDLTIFFKETKANALVMGIDRHFFSILPHEVLQGRTFFNADYLNQKQICLLSSELAKELFTYKDPINYFIEINGMPFRIAGVVRSTTDQMSGKNVFVPLSSQSLAEMKLNQQPTVLIQATNADFLEAAVLQAAKQLTTLVPPSDYVFAMKNYDDVKKMTAEINRSNLILLGGIASISLLVGGIGVMNTMLVSVTERTREIGLKKAIGATRKMILQQFLTEAIVLSMVGGILGIVIGIFVSRIGTHFLDYPFTISVLSICISVSFSVIIGVIFGFLPAYKASKLNPIDALRYE